MKSTETTVELKEDAIAVSQRAGDPATVYICSVHLSLWHYAHHQALTLSFNQPDICVRYVHCRDGCIDKQLTYVEN